jgi:hypothetical protein
VSGVRVVVLCAVPTGSAETRGVGWESVHRPRGPRGALCFIGLPSDHGRVHGEWHADYHAPRAPGWRRANHQVRVRVVADAGLCVDRPMSATVSRETRHRMAAGQGVPGLLFAPCLSTPPIFPSPLLAT